jgi:hypothetical protein
MPKVVQATRFALIAYAIGLLAVGVDRPEPRWLRVTWVDSSKAFGVLIMLAIIGHVLSGAQAKVRGQCRIREPSLTVAEPRTVAHDDPAV